MTKIDLKTLNEYEKDGWIKSQKHPYLPLLIWNYTPQTQYSKYWTEVTLQCRGLVTNLDGVIVARPFKKFFNYEELNPEDIPNEDYVIYEKMDGSLGILFYYEYDLIEKEKYDKSNYEPTPKRKGEWVFATRGSFTSPQSIKGKELLKKYPLDKLNKDNTYLFEIIY